MSDKNLTLALRRVRKSVRTNVDTGKLAAIAPSIKDTGTVCKPTLTCGGSAA